MGSQIFLPFSDRAFGLFGKTHARTRCACPRVPDLRRAGAPAGVEAAHVAARFQRLTVADSASAEIRRQAHQALEGRHQLKRRGGCPPARGSRRESPSRPGQRMPPRVVSSRDRLSGVVMRISGGRAACAGGRCGGVAERVWTRISREVAGSRRASQRRQQISLNVVVERFQRRDVEHPGGAGSQRRLRTGSATRERRSGSCRYRWVPWPERGHRRRSAASSLPGRWSAHRSGCRTSSEWKDERLPSGSSKGHDLV